MERVLQNCVGGEQSTDVFQRHLLVQGDQERCQVNAFLATFRTNRRRR